MKVLLTTLNAKFVHTSLALWYIYQYCRDSYPELTMTEYNINQELGWVLGEIYREHAAVVAFSCNIWNIEQILILVRRLKQVAPKTLILLGGPEVGADPIGIMQSHTEIDFIIVGEGEITFAEWLEQLKRDSPDWKRVAGLVYREEKVPQCNPPRPEIRDLGILKFPYPEDLTPFRKKLVYYETTRGCPYQCQYCLSANEHGVRFFPMERVKRELLRFIEAKIAQVKLVDRSFNADLQWAKEIWRFLIDHPGETNFHFEINGDHLDDESLAILDSAPPGLFQFEIGVQSTHPETIKLIRRATDFHRLEERTGHLIRSGRVFVHLDLIAGLPGENYQSFTKSFNDCMRLNPHRLQLGFLKMLRGSGLRAQAQAYNYQYTQEPPYEVLGNPWLSYAELLRLKQVEDVLELYYNSEGFRFSLQFLTNCFETPFHFWESFAYWWKRQGYDQCAHKSIDLYEYLLCFFKNGQASEDAVPILRNLLKFDLLGMQRMVELPAWAGGFDTALREFSFNFWKDEENRRRYLGEYAALTIREIQRRVVFARFEYDPLHRWDTSPDLPRKVERLYLFVYHPKKVRRYLIK